MPSFVGTAFANRSGAFTPYDLGPSLWLEADQLSTLFTTVSGTTTPADTGTVGRWLDRSGNGFDLTAAADDTTRPTWNAGGGFPYVNFDGSNDVLRRTASLGMYEAGALSMFVATRANPTGGQHLVSERSSSSTAPFYIFRSNSADADDFEPGIRNDASSTLN
jgi:hypothetical protein